MHAAYIREENGKLKRLVADLSLDRHILQEIVAKVVKPRQRRTLAQWAQDCYQVSEHHAAGLLSMSRSTLRRKSRRDPQVALRMRLRELAASRVRYGYRRLTVLLRREGWKVNAKRIYRRYTEEGLIVRTQQRKKLASRNRVSVAVATAPNIRWSMDLCRRA